MNAVRHILALADPETEIGDDCAVLPLAEMAPRNGETIDAFVGRAGWDLQLMPTICRVGKRYYARTEWTTKKIPANGNVLFISRPAGGGGGGGGQGKAIGAAVAMIALSVLAPFAAPALGFATGTLGASLITVGLTAGGAFLLSHFLQPKAATPSDKSPDLYTFSFQGNQPRPQQVIPVNYGRRKIFPDFGAPTYSEYDGDDMIDYGLYCLGVGRHRIEEIYLSDTLIWTVDSGFLPGFGLIEAQYLEPGEDVTLFPVNVVTSSEVAGIQLSANITEDGEEDSIVGPYVANAAGTDAAEIIVDFVFPSGLYYQKGNDVLGNTVQINVRLWPTNAAGAISGPGILFTETFTASKNSQLRVTKRYPVAGGRYSVSVQRIQKEPTSPGAIGEVVWSALRAHIQGPQSFPNVTMLALKAKADNGLQTLAGGKVGVVATRILPVFKDDQWQELPTRSIAWAAFDAWTNEVYSAGLPSTGVDLDSLLTYDAFWDQADHTFDHQFTESSSVIEALETILKAGRAVPAILGDTMSIMRDEDRGLPSLVFTDNQIVRGSLAIDYTLYNSALADGVIGSYLDETTWRVAEVSSAPDGVALANPARVELTGVTKRAQAAGLVRFQAGDSAYRRTQVTFQVEAEGKLIRRGMLIAVQSELPQAWGGSGVVLSATGNTLNLDQTLDWSGQLYLTLRAADGTPWGPVRVSQGAAPNVAVVDATDANTVTGQTGRSLAAVLARSSGQEQPSFAWGGASQQVFRCLVKEGSPDGDYLTLVAVNDDPRVYEVVEDGVPPIGGVPSFLNETDPPIITQLAGRMVQEGLAAKINGGWKPAKNALTYQARISFDNGTTWTSVYEGAQTQFSAVVNPADLLLQVRGISPKSIPGAWSQVAVAGITIDLSNVDLEIDIANLKGELLYLINLISGLGEGSIADLRAKVDKLTEQIANMAATTAAHEFSERKAIKVTLGQDIAKNYAAIVQEARTRISQNEAFAEVQTALQAALTSIDGQVSGLSTAISTLSTTVTTQGGQITSLSSSYLGLDARLASAEGNITGQASSVSSLLSQVSSLNGTVSATSSQLTALSTTVDGHTSTLTTYGSSIDGLRVQWGVVGYIDGSRGGFVMQGVRRNDGGANWNLLIDANVFINGNLVVDGTIQTSKVAPQAISGGIVTASGAGTASCPPIFVGQGCVAVITASIDGYYTPPAGTGVYWTIFAGGNQYYSLLGHDTSWAYFPQSKTIIWYNPGGDTYISPGLTVTLPYSCSIYAMSLKR